MKQVLLLTGHFPHQKRRASMLWIAQMLQEQGWHVTIATIGYSWISRLRRDPRLSALPSAPFVGTRHSATQSTLFDWSPIHPFSLGNKTANRLLGRSQTLFVNFWEKRLKEPLQQADLVITESGAPVMLGPLLSRYAPQAARIYRVNDDMRLLNAPQYLLDAERELPHHVTRISSASPHLLRRFKHPNKTLDPMGLARAHTQTPGTSPFTPRAACELVCAGTTQIDLDALSRLARSRPDWRFHILGRLKGTAPQQDNLLFLGEQSYDETLRYIAHADIGLAPYLDRPGVEYQITNSNRLLLYRHFGLPILGPKRLCDPSVPAILDYTQPDAPERARQRPKTPEALPDWSDLARALAQNDETEPPLDVAIPPDRLTCPRVNTVPPLASIARF